MGRHQTNVHMYRRPGSPRWSDPYYREWAVVIGERIRRLRTERGWRLHELAGRVPKPEGGYYSVGYFSRLERGWGNAPLYVYIVVAEVFEVQPGVLFGPDEVQRGLTPEQGVLLQFLESAGIHPGEAIARLSGLTERGGGPATE
jgi:transcriptional regulator with XRE-family HTH domain